ncbi:xanthine dehydrogenase family protein molybdopterin-binding subunit [Candidatus Acetothermia bacterium]|nr:xanthine dehydrogenase family protein molybdopterin-binding subunit [Candidatus Acetothermia bacterium]
MARVVKTKTEFEGNFFEQYIVIEGDELTPWAADEKLEKVGKCTPRVDGSERVTGDAKYTYDIQLAGMLYGRILRSPYPHARIKSLDTRAAEKLHGVRAVLTHKNIPQIPLRMGQHFLLEPTLRYAGDEVAFIVADDEEIAEDALELIEVDYQELPFVIDPEEASQPSSPQIHLNGNVLNGKPEEYERGDAEKALREADVTIEARFTTQVALHNSLETHGSVCAWEGDSLTVWDSTQHIYGVRAGVAQALGLPLNKVRVIKKYMGGGFGSKNGAGKYTLLAALAAKKVGRPVHMMLTRKEENLAAGNRNNTIQYLRLGAKRDGTLTAIYLRSYAGLGAYSLWGTSPGGPARQLYACPNVKTIQYSVFTNTGPMAAFRAPGYVEGTFSFEQAIDMLAQKLHMDPLELRLKNYIDTNPMSGMPYSTKGLREAYERGAKLIGWRERKSKKITQGTQRRGFGMASQIWGGSGGPPAYALCKLNNDGSATIITGTQDIGTGTKTVLAQIAAEELGFPIERVSVELGDTQDGVYSPLSAGSMTLPSVGPAVRVAAHDAKEQLLSIAAQVLEKPKDQIKLKDGLLHVQGLEKPVELKEVLAMKLQNFMIIGKGARGPNPEKYSVNTFGAQFADVTVDTETGEVLINKIVAVHESGRVINPLTIGSQIEGGVIQGLGFALTEERVLDRHTGLVLNPNLEEYKVPTALDVPEIEHEMIDRADPYANNLGAKGVGEPPIIPTAAAIANAISDAIGVHVTDGPITPDKILKALNKTQIGGNHA